MRPGLIRKVLDFHEDYYRLDCRVAFNSFFGKRKDLVDEHEGLFLEWLAFDFRLAMGKTFLENFLEKKSEELSSAEIKEYAELIETNIFGLFEILKIKKDHGMTLENIVTEKRYEVREKLGTHFTHKGDLVFVRVGKIEDHWEIVGCKVISFGQFNIDRRISSQWKSKGAVPDLKEMFRLFYVDRKNDLEKKFGSDLEIDPVEAREKLEKFLKKNNLFEHLSANLVESWLFTEGEKGAFLEKAEDLLSIFFGLLQENKNRNKLMGELVPILMNFANTIGRKRFKGKNPQQMSGKIEPQLRSSLRQFSAEGVEFFDQGVHLMKDCFFPEAQLKFEAGFAELLKSRIPVLEAYRAYANLAVCLLSQGQLVVSRKLLRIAVKLNPTYGFAGRTLEKLESGALESQIRYGRRKYGKQFGKSLYKNAPIEYFAFLKSSGINFTTKEAPVEKVRTLKPQKVKG